jgi:hypothetical protein
MTGHPAAVNASVGSRQPAADGGRLVRRWSRFSHAPDQLLPHKQLQWTTGRLILLLENLRRGKATGATRVAFR